MSLNSIDISESKRILLIEDNDSNREMLSEYLKHLGYQVLSLSDGAQFLQAMADFRPNLILLDLVLPGIDGYSLIQKIQQQSEWQHIPIVVLSALSFRVDRKRALSLGARRFLVKPASPDQLKLVLNEYLS